MNDVTQSLTRADRHLVDAKTCMSQKMYAIAAREAYFVVFHAAHALLYFRGNNQVKTHSGLRTVVGAAVVSGDAPRELGELLMQGYETKETADYGDADLVSEKSAKELVLKAGDCLAMVKSIVVGD